MPPAKARNDLDAVFAELRRLLRPLAGDLVVQKDEPGDYQLDTRHQHRGTPLYFGGVAIRKGAVSFYLFPVYLFPDLLEDASPALRKRMQGKSCFHFKAVDPALFGELAALARRGLDALASRPLPR